MSKSTTIQVNNITKQFAETAVGYLVGIVLVIAVIIATFLAANTRGNHRHTVRHFNTSPATIH